MKSKFYSMEEWEKASGQKHHNMPKKQAIALLKERGIPTHEVYVSGFPLKMNEIEKFQKYKPFIAVLLNENYEKFHRYFLKNAEDVQRFVQEQDSKLQEIMLIQQILPIKNSFVGTLVSDGKGEGIIEIYHENTTDVRDLTSRGCNPSLLDTVTFYDYGRILKKPTKTKLKEIKKIIDYGSYYRGYFEFVKGKLGDMVDIYFTDFHTNKSVIEELLS